jgi:hypothetical protein
MNTIDFFTYVLSSISFWLGFAPYEFLNDYDFLGCRYLCHRLPLKGNIAKNTYLTRSQIIAAKMKAMNIESRKCCMNLYGRLLNSWFRQTKIEMELLLRKADMFILVSGENGSAADTASKTQVTGHEVTC